MEMKMDNEDLKLPAPTELPNYDYKLPFGFVGDHVIVGMAFCLKENLLMPYLLLSIIG